MNWLLNDVYFQKLGYIQNIVMGYLVMGYPAPGESEKIRAIWKAAVPLNIKVII